MKILLLAPANSIHTQRWFLSLCERGHAVTLVSQHQPISSRCPPNGNIQILPYSGKKGYFLNALAVRRIVKELTPDLINAHYASGYGTTAALVGYRPTLLSVWGSDVFDFPYESWWKLWLIRWNLRRASALASTSRIMAQQVKRLIPDKHQEIFITPFGVDTTNFLPKSFQNLDTLTIGTVKSLSEKYGIDTLIHAFAQLRADDHIGKAGLKDRLRLLIVGDGPQRDALERLTQELGVAGFTRFIGAVDHDSVPEWLNCLDIYVAASRFDSESFGVAILEASACELPVVVSDAGGLPEVVDEGESGFIVPRDRPDLLADCLRRLSLNPALRLSLGTKGRQLVKKIYSWDVCVDKMINIYQSLIISYRR